jgi:hypothetical protein
VVVPSPSDPYRSPGIIDVYDTKHGGLVQSYVIGSREKNGDKGYCPFCNTYVSSTKFYARQGEGRKLCTPDRRIVISSGFFGFNSKCCRAPNYHTHYWCCNNDPFIGGCGGRWIIMHDVEFHDVTE